MSGKKVRTAEIILEYSGYIDGPPMTSDEMWGRATGADKPTMDMWKDIWINNVTQNKKTYGSFAAKGLGKLWNKHLHQPVILAGSGPSLQKNGHLLKDRPEGVLLISCLHNFHFMEDKEACVDYYVSLDAGPVTIEEVSEGGSKEESVYWEKTKDKTLICFIGTDPKLLEKWEGEVYFFNSPIPNEEIRNAISAQEVFNTHVSSGGHVLGAALHIAKGQLGCGTVIWVGADYSFSNVKKRTFHAWDSKYDADLGRCVVAVDCFGNRAITWASYMNFKIWTDYIVQRVPGTFINSTEGGILGAYREGNIKQIIQQDLADTYKMFDNSFQLKDCCLNPETKLVKILF